MNFSFPLRKTTTTTKSSKTSLHDLPPELMEAIAEQVSPQDLLSLRLMSRDINAKVHRTVTKVHFTDKTFLLPDEQSMQALEDISKHAVFGKSLKTVRLSDSHVVEPSYRHQQAVRDTRQARRKNREMRQIHDSIFAAQRSYMALLNILLNFNCPLPNLTLGGFGLNVGLDLFDTRLSQHRNLTAMFGGIRKLTISIDGICSAYNANRPLLDPAAAGRHGITFSTVLNKLPNLEHLSLTTGRDWTPTKNRYFTAMAATTHLPALRELELHDIRTNEEILTRLLARHTQTLKRVVVAPVYYDGTATTLGEVEQRVKRAMGETDVELELSEPDSDDEGLAYY
ncbi:hypothetical protein LTR08_007130 [Meristemomyces frigidus]|nr:hypothetical protein LTR08_007130 [Meristemomyces frigidus]